MLYVENKKVIGFRVTEEGSLQIMSEEAALQLRSCG